MIRLSNLIGGRRVEAISGDTFPNIDPATGRTIAHIPASDAEDVDAAVNAAHSALDGAWGRSTSAERADLCDAVADHIEARLDEFADLECADTGKPIRIARTIDIPRAIANFRFFAGAVRHDKTGSFEMADAINYTTRRPLGVVGLITPWNLPLYLLSWKTAPALATGNAIVAKPSELTPLTASALATAIDELGAPPGTFNVVHGTGVQAGAALVAHPDVQGISFTGGTKTGALVGAHASSAFKKLSLELGGKNSTLVFDDADMTIAVDGAVRAAFTNQGQVCLCGSRLLVQEGVYDAFVSAFVSRVRKLKVGDPTDPTTDLGALISEDHRAKVERYIRLAEQEGGEIATGGVRPNLAGRLRRGAFLEPTVVVGLSPDARTSCEEIFGPVVTIHKFSDAAEAIRIANSVRYGLAASVWTSDLSTAHKTAAALDVGMVWVNTWLKRDLRVPFGGVKDSGVGREGGHHSLEFYTEEKNICIQL